MPRSAVPLDSIVVCSRLFIVALLSLAFGAIPSLAQTQDEPGKTVASKSNPEDKSAIDEKHPLFIPLQMAYKASEQLKEIEDYECIFTKRELLGKKLLKSTMKLKFRDEPFSVYLKFIDNNPGREVLFVKGQNSNNLLVREAGVKGAILGVVPLAPTGPDALAENKYPVTSIGIKQLLGTVIKQWEAEGKFSGTSAQKRPNSKLPTGEVCTVYEAVHEKPYKDFKFHTTRLWIEDKTGLAIGVQQLGFPGKNDTQPPMVEEYFYSNLKTNLKLTDTDFDKNNPNYAFK